jgi:hypothetical protein
MENFAQTLRESTINFLNGKEVENEHKLYVDKFLYYTDAYCAEMKTTIEEILHNDKTYNMVFRLFNSVILTKQLNLELV